MASSSTSSSTGTDSTSSDATDTFVGLFEDPTRYSQAYRTVLRYADYYEVVDNWYSNIFPRDIVDKLAPKDQPIRILGVGSGAGEIDLKIALSIQARWNKVHNTVVDPSQDQNDLYRQLLETTTDEGVQNIIYDFRQQTIEEYRQEKANRGRKFDFISIVHCLYHVRDYDDTVGYLYECLEEGGILLCVSCTESASYTVIQKTFPQTCTPVNKPITSSDICQSLERRGIIYQTSPQDVKFDLTKHLDNSAPSEETDLVIDFFSMLIDVKNQAPKFYREFVNFLTSDPRGVKRTDDGKLILDGSAEAVFVQK